MHPSTSAVNHLVEHDRDRRDEPFANQRDQVIKVAPSTAILMRQTEG
jgi:hypothetical protein